MAVGTGSVFPISLNDYPIKIARDEVTKEETNLQSSSIAALERKVGINGSSSHTSHDYKLSEIVGANKSIATAGTQNIILGGTTIINNLNINNSYQFPPGDGLNGEVLTTDGAGNLTFESSASGGADILEIQIFI